LENPVTFTPEQLIERQKYVGGSEGAAALGLNPFFTELELYFSKLGEGQPIETTIPMMVGTALEPVAIELFERETHFKVEERQGVFVDELNPWRRCTLDGYVHQERAIIEAKSSGDFRGWGDGDDEIPEHYLLNAAHSLGCIPEAQCVYFPVLIGGRTYRTYQVHRDVELVRMVLEGERAFMDLVRKRRPPAPKTREDLKLLYPKDNGLSVTATPEIEATARAIAKAKAEIKTHTAIQDEGILAVAAFMGPHASLRKLSLVGTLGDTLATFNGQERRTIDADLLRANYPAIARECTKVGNNRVYLNKIKDAK
jgi:putative phage-type endonuclease